MYRHTHTYIYLYLSLSLYIYIYIRIDTSHWQSSSRDNYDYIQSVHLVYLQVPITHMNPIGNVWVYMNNECIHDVPGHI